MPLDSLELLTAAAYLPCLVSVGERCATSHATPPFDGMRIRKRAVETGQLQGRRAQWLAGFHIAWRYAPRLALSTLFMNGTQLQLLSECTALVSNPWFIGPGQILGHQWPKTAHEAIIHRLRTGNGKQRSQEPDPAGRLPTTRGPS
ncbi:hypothetical protein LY78DRAFT_277569 [Colletotrichum sublineola]|nr:hypothetical protein LY78DRAFT_277569 [Colletotrichum sublineola]